MFPGICAQGGQGVPLGCLKGLLAGACFPLQLFRRFQEMRPREYGALHAFDLHCNIRYILCLHLAGLAGISTAKNLSTSPPPMLVTAKPLHPMRKRSPSSHPSMIYIGEKEEGRNGTDYKDISNKEQELSSEGKGSKVRRPS